MVKSVAVAADHGGFILKASLVAWLKNQGYEVVDVGASVFDDKDDYPDYAERLAETVVKNNVERGLLICGSGVGASIAANKIPGAHACICHDTYSAHQGVEHDNMNILCLGGRVIGIELAKELVSAFLNAAYQDEGQYKRRVDKIIDIERKFLRL